MNLGSVIHKVVAAAEADAAKVKSALLKTVQELDGVILPEAETLQPLIEQVANAVAPGGSKVVDVAFAWLESAARVLDAGGAAAEANLANAGLDVATIAAIKGLIPALKAATVTK
jgi:hypothetical protein